MQAQRLLPWLVLFGLSGCATTPRPATTTTAETGAVDYCDMPADLQPSRTVIRLLPPTFKRRQSPGDEWAGFERGSGTARLMYTTTILANFSLDRHGCALFSVPTAGKVEIATCVPNSVEGNNCWQPGECFYHASKEFTPNSTYAEFSLAYGFGCYD